MSLIARIKIWVPGDLLTAANLNGEFNNILNDYNGSIDHTNIGTIADTILWSLSTNVTGIRLIKSAIGAGNPIYITNQGTGDGVLIEQQGNANAMQITSSGGGHGIKFATSGAGDDLRGTANSWYVQSDGDASFNSITTVVASGSSVPIGSIIPFYDFNGGLTFNAANWAYCNGQSIAVGALGAQTLPDLSNRYLVGFGTEGGADNGSAVWNAAVVGNASHQVNLAHIHTVAAHTHDLGDHTHTGPIHTHTMGNHTHAGPSHTHDMGNHTHARGTFHARIILNSDGADGVLYQQEAVADWVADDRDDAGSDQGGGQTLTQAVPIAGTSATPSTNTTGASGTGATGAPSNNNTDAAGNGATGVPSTNITSSASSATDSQLSAAQSVQPRSIRVRFIMRIA